MNTNKGYTKTTVPRIPGLDLLTTNSLKVNKTFENSAQSILTAVCYLIPNKTFCPYASAACMRGCLVNSGQGGMSEVVRNARQRRSDLFRTDPKKFVRYLMVEMEKVIVYCEKRNIQPTFRLNGTSDLLWERYGIPQEFPTIQFYDYTKIPIRYRKVPNNYHLTFSWSGTNKQDCLDALDRGVNVAVPFRKLPETFLGYPVFDGDQSDARFLDPFGICGLKYKRDTRKLALRTVADDLGDFVQ